MNQKQKNLSFVINEYHKYEQRLKVVRYRLFIRRFKHIWIFHKLFVINSAITIILLLLLGYKAFFYDNHQIIIDNSTHTTSVKYYDTVNTQHNFLMQLKKMESNGNHLARNKYEVYDITDKGIDTIVVYSQYIGYYQLGLGARKSIGFDKYTDDEYWKNPKLQEESMIKWLKYLKKQLNPYINVYDKKWIGMFYITESGIIAMAHLCGPEATKKFLLSSGSPKDIPRDGNKKPGTDYLQQLGRYNLNLD